MNTRSRRRWLLPVYLVVLGLWGLAVVVSFVVFDGPSSPVAWLQIGVIFLALVFLIGGELSARREGP